MTNRRTSAKLLSAFLGLTLLAAACGDDDDDAGGGDDVTTTTAAPGGGGDDEGQAGGDLVLGAEQFPDCVNPITQCANSSWMHWAVTQHVLPKAMEFDENTNFVPSPVLSGEPTLAGEGVDDSGDPFSVTYPINPDAVWDDGSPISCADFEFTWQAKLNTTGVVSTVGYDLIESVEEGDGGCVVTYSSPYADWWDNFGGNSDYILKAAAFDGPDISAELATEIPFSGAPWVLDSFDPTTGEAVLLRNEAYWDEERMPLLDSVTMLRQEDTETELNALLAGEIAAIYPQPSPGMVDTIESGDTTEFTVGFGVTYEGVWFNQGSLLNTETPLKDPAVREALLYLFDRETIIADIVAPDSPGTELLNCAGWVPTVGDWCDNTDFEDVTYDPAHAAEVLEGAGWALGGDGIYEKDGQRLSITWQTVAGNARREAIQDLVIPAVAEAGVELVAQNQDPDTLFQISLPQMQFEIGLYAQTASPDPSVTSIYACENIPSEENQFAGQNNMGWCNEEATALAHESDSLPDAEDRLPVIQQLGDLVREDAVWLPFYQLPLITAWDSAAVGGPVDVYTNTPGGAFVNMYDWFIPA